MSIVTRVCHRCKVARPLSDFYIQAERRASARRGKNTKMPCRHCARAYQAQAREDRQAYVDQVKTESGCVDCGLHPEVLAVLEFDHRPGEVKSFYVSRRMVGKLTDDFKAEIAKCDVVCANCHRVRTITREQLGAFFGGTRTGQAQINKDRIAGLSHIWSFDEMVSALPDNSRNQSSLF